MTTKTKTTIADLIAAAKQAAREIRDGSRFDDPAAKAKYRVAVDVLVAYTGREGGETYEDDKWVSPSRIKPGHRAWAVRFRDNTGSESDPMDSLETIAETKADWIG